MVQFISKHNKCERYAQLWIYIFRGDYIYFLFCPRVRSAFFFWQWIKAKSSRNPQDLRWKVILGSANKYSWQIVNFLFSELFLKMIHRLIVWTFTWNHDSILALPHWKIDLKICSLQFPYLFFFAILNGYCSEPKSIILALSYGRFLDPPECQWMVMTQILSCLKWCYSMK